MRGIIPGKVEPKVWLGVCNECGAVLEAEPADLWIQVGNHLTNYAPYAWHKCLFCDCEGSVCFTKRKKVLL
jgi:hypothetical protein